MLDIIVSSRQKFWSEFRSRVGCDELPFSAGWLPEFWTLEDFTDDKESKAFTKSQEVTECTESKWFIEFRATMKYKDATELKDSKESTNSRNL
jgi:hypothetical protein